MQHHTENPSQYNKTKEKKEDEEEEKEIVRKKKMVRAEVNQIQNNPEN